MDGNDLPEYALYLRKSKGRAGISRQRTTTTVHVEKLGGRIIREFKDTDRTAYQKVGAARPRRDEFDEMLAMLRARPGLRVAAWHADRLTRNSEDTEELIRVCASGDHPVETRSGGSYDLSTATGRKRFRADALDAQYEVDHMTERIVAMKAEHAAEGRWLGGRRPFGWRIDSGAPGGLVLDVREAAALAQAHRDVLDRKSLHAIARDWNAAGIATSAGGRWAPTEVRRVLQRPSNAAPPPAQWPAIVDGATHRAVVALLSHPERKTSPGPERRHLLSGIALCGVCGKFLTASSRGNGRGSRTVYRCRRGEGAGHVARDGATLDDAITRLALARLSMPDARSLLARDTGGQLAALRRERTALEGLMRESNELRRRRLLTAAEFAEDRAGHLEQLAALDAKIAAAEADDVLAPMLADPEAAWKSRDLSQRRAVVDALMVVRVRAAGSPEEVCEHCGELLPATAAKGRPKGWRPGQPYFDMTAIHIEWRRE